MSVSSIGAAAPPHPVQPAKNETAPKQPAKAEHHEAKPASQPRKSAHKVDVKA